MFLRHVSTGTPGGGGGGGGGGALQPIAIRVCAAL